MLLSLSAIVGPSVSPLLIERFIRTFAPFVDEMILVAAFGNRSNEETLTAAARLASEINLRLSIGHYENAAEFAEWPHTSDFGAARNVALGMAAGDWIMWADTDDLISDEHGRILRRAVEHANASAEYDMVKMMYHVPSEQIKNNLRERVVRKGKCVWRGRVHECLDPLGPCKALLVDNAFILHAPLADREPGSERNLRILRSIPEEERTLSASFYLFQEEMVAGNVERAVEIAQAYMVDPAAGENEKYEILIHLARVSPDPRTRGQYLMTAVGTDPRRREALGELAMLEMNHGDKPSRAEAFLRQMDALPRPPLRQTPWNLRDSFYGYEAIRLWSHFYRMTDRADKADVIEFNHFHKHGALISLLHATRGRPKQAVEARNRWLMRAANPDAIEHIFAIDIDDELSNPLALFRHISIEPNRGPCAAWNAALSISSGKVVIQLSDDWNPQLHWDQLVLSRLRSVSPNLDTPAVLAVSDGSRRDGLICMAICTRAALKRSSPVSALRSPLYLFHPSFFSMFSDNWFTEEMRARDIVIDAPDLVFEHLHPAFGKAEMDETYSRSNNLLHYATGASVLAQLQAGQEPFTWQNIRGWDDGSPAKLHAQIMADLPPDTMCVEVGVAYGRGLACMAAIACFLFARKKHLLVPVGVDNFEGTQGETTDYAEDMEAQCRDNLKRACFWGIRLIKAASASPLPALPLLVSYVFIDADHSYEAVRADIEAWTPRIAPGGTIAGHDYFDAPGVKQAVDERFGDRVQTFGQCWFVKL